MLPDKLRRAPVQTSNSCDLKMRVICQQENCGLTAFGMSLRKDLEHL